MNDLTQPQFIAGRALDAKLTGMAARCIRYIFSDPSVGRDMHTIAPDAWQTANFLRNPVFLWAHQSDEPPIGRVENLRTEGLRLVGDVRYAERDAYPFADTIYELTKRGFLNATSTGWIPLEWSAANDRSRPGGLDFTKVELLEISGVPVPALPTALATARAQGVDTAPIFAWAERMLDNSGFAAVPRPELEELRKAAKMPPSRRRSAPPQDEGNLPSPPEAARASAPPPHPEEPQRGVSKDEGFTGLAQAAFKRGLGDVAEMCIHMSNLERCYGRCFREAEVERDGSPIPGRFRDWLDDGHRMLRDMAKEETQEQINGTQAPDDPYRASTSSAQAIEAMIERVLARAGLTRKGAAISAANRERLRGVHGHVKAAHEALSDMLENGDDDNPEGAVDADITYDDLDSRAFRERRARALQAKIRGVQS